MNGTLYAVGVGPGDPELLTQKAVRIQHLADVIVCPAKGDAPGVAYRIAEAALPEIIEKELQLLSFPMTGINCSKAHKEAADAIVALLKDGKNVAFLTLGDPGFYSTFSYIQDAVINQGFPIEAVSGIPSFCAASARFLVPLATGDEQVLITTEPQMEFPGTIIVMKVGKRLRAIKEMVASSGRTAHLVENCGMEDESVYSGVNSMPDTSGYFSLMIIEPQTLAEKSDS